MGLLDWLDERTGYRRSLAAVRDRPLAGGASFAHAIGSVVLFFFALQAITGALLSFYYSPSSSDAWASVAYVEDQVSLGWLVRGVHHHGASAMVLATGAYLLVALVRGSYYRPREGVWWTGVCFLLLVMGFALTGDLLPWDQNGFWATRVRLGYAGAAPGGAQVESALQGGNDLGNLTLTRFHALHVVVLPALAAVVVVVHLALQRRLGVAPSWGRSEAVVARATRPYWPEQAFRDAVAVTVAFGALVVWTLHRGGAPLAAPADPSAAYDARPAWFERGLFQLVRLSPSSIEAVVATAAPALLGLALLALPFIDRGADRSLRRRWWVLALAALTIGGVASLTLMSFRADASDATFTKHQEAAQAQAAKARRLAREHGVPAEGGTAVFTTAPFHRARTLWKQHCEGCHESKDRKAPLITAGFNNRAWIRGMLTTPSGDDYFGRTKLGKSEEAMPAAEVEGADLDALVELVYAETGAPDVDAKLVERGAELFTEQPCGDCHERTGDASSSGPNLAGRGTVDNLTTLIGDTGQARFFGERHQMKRFADELGPEDRERLAEYVVWLRTATPADIEKLDE